MLDAKDQFHVISSGVSQIIPEDALFDKLKSGRVLNIKLGVDPTAPDIHLGHAVPLRKLRQFQDLGHKVTLIIGDGTALIGDPSGRNSTRPQLSRPEIMKNAQTYVDQAFKILNPDMTELKYNADWLLDLNLEGLLKLASNFTVARILERDDFSNRYASGQSISLHEFLYPVMQAYDSVVIRADVEVGGTDQLFNLLAGRELMEKVGMEPQVCLTLPLLEGTDGVRKMSKSYGNYIGVTDDPKDMFGKVMSIPDELMVKYFRLASSLAVSEIDQIESGLALGNLDPNRTKRRLACDIVASYYDEDAAREAEEHFDRVYKYHEAPDDIEEFRGRLKLNDDGEVYLPGLLSEAGFTKGTGEARRLIDGGGVRIDGSVVGKKAYNVPPEKLHGSILKVGRSGFIRIP